MIHELTNNEVFSNEYRNIAPKAGDLAAVFEKNGRKDSVSFGISHLERMNQYVTTTAVPA